MKTKILTIITMLCLAASGAIAETSLGQKLSGKILLQIEAQGQAWYVNPADHLRYYLGRPTDAWAVMKKLSLGINNADLEKIAVGLIDYQGSDVDSDGLPDAMEKALGTNINQADTDNDGFTDHLELKNGYRPNGPGKLPIDRLIALNHSGRILLQVQGDGACWYLNPVDQKRYYLGRPADAWLLMKKLSLGISDNNLLRINQGGSPPGSQNCPECQAAETEENILSLAAASIRDNDKEKTKTYFVDSMSKSIDYTLEKLSPSSRLLLANLLSGSSFSSVNQQEKKYTNKAYFSPRNAEVPLTFYVRKQPDGSWKIANL